MMETLLGLLAQGWRVELLARVCEITGEPDLHWTKVRTPRRPFVLAFPLFALAAGARVLRARREGVPIVTLGAIVPNRVDVITVQFCQAGFASEQIRRPSRSSWLWRVHSRVSQALALGLERWCYRPGRVKRMTAVSELVKQELHAHYKFESVPVDVIANGVDTRRFRPDADTRQQERRRLGLRLDELVAVFVGGDWPRKGLDIAIDAAALAGWTLLVVGQGDIAVWAARAREQGAKVQFCGHVAEPERFLCAADAFMLPSRYEGFALVTIEAAAAGLPLLVTAATGAAALVQCTGRLPLAHEAGAFAAELRRLGDDPDLRAEISRRGRAAAEELTWPHIVRAYERAYSAAGR